MSPANLISIVLPAHNEADNIRPVYRAISEALRDEGQCWDFEIIFLDDGSRDRTAEEVRRLAAESPGVRLVRLTRNFGHQAALLAGLQYAHGRAVITMDCDLQHPPEYLPRMIDAWRNGAWVVQMVRASTADASWFKKTSSAAFYRVIRFLSETPVVRGVADFQLLDAEVVRALLQFKDCRPFLRGAIAWLGFPSCQIEYVANKRHAGNTSYSLRKMLHLCLDAVTTLSAKPLRISFYVGLLVVAVCCVYGVFIVAEYLRGNVVPGWASLILIVMFLGAVQLISVGVL